MDRVIGGVLSTKTRVVVTSFAPCVSAAQRVITLQGGQAIHGGFSRALHGGQMAAPDAGRTQGEDERWQVSSSQRSTFAALTAAASCLCF